MGLPDVVLTVSALLATAVVVGLLAERVRVPVTVVLVVVGFLASAVGSVPGLESLRTEAFEEVLVYGFLPVLVFQAVLGLSIRHFFRNLGPILALATVALAISAALVGAALNVVLGVPLVSALLFGTLISATDPVAVVAVFTELGVPKRLLTLVEGESLLNDGVAIVGFNILLVAALGGAVSPLQGVVDFVVVFGGGTVIGAGIGLVAAAVLPWLDRLGAAALSLSVAYGGFVLADHVLGFSGVMATVAAGLVLGGLAPSRASQEVRDLWRQLWEALDHVANAVLFLLIGLVLDPALLGRNIGAIALAAAAVLVARAVAVVPLASALERFAGVPRFGRRNEAVLVWGGLRGGVALALALALPEELAGREVFVAMTGGVVLTTLLLNATTITALVHRLGLDRPSRSDRFLAASARLSGLEAARRRLGDLGLDDAAVDAHLDAAERETRDELARVQLDPREELQVVVGRGLAIERQTYQHLSDAGLLPAPATRTLLHEVDDQLDELSAGARPPERVRRRDRPRLDDLVRRVVGWLPQPPGEDPRQLAFAEAAARRLAARRTAEALELFDRLPNVDAATVASARETFAQWEREATEALDELDAAAEDANRRLHEQQAEALSRTAAADALDELVGVGLLPPMVARRAAESLTDAPTGSAGR